MTAVFGSVTADFFRSGYMSENGEKIQDRGISVKGGALGWLENFWYHYKWHFIGGLVAFVIIFVCIVQSCTKREEDILVVYAGPAYMSQAQLSSIVEVLGNTMPRDFDGNGDRFANIDTFQIYSEEQVKAIIAETDADGNNGYVDRNLNSSNFDQYSKYILTGESSVYLLDRSLYENLRNNGRLMLLSDVLTDTPKGVLEDGYGVRLGDTALYEEFAVMRVLPEDTVICLMKQHIGGKSRKDKLYCREKEMFAALVDCTVKE